MKKKIERLTPEQEAELPRFRQEMLDIACGGGRADRSELQNALTAAYSEIGRPAPRLFIFDSPAACMLAIKIFKLGSSPKFKLGDQLMDQLGDRLGDQLWDQLGVQLRDQLGVQLRDQLMDRLGDRLGDQLWDQLGVQLRDQLGVQLMDQLRDQLMDQLGSQLRGQLGVQLRDQLMDQLRGQLGDQLGDQLRRQLMDQLWGQLRDQLWDQLMDQLRDQLGDQLRVQHLWSPNFLWGSQDLYWIAWGQFAQRIGVKLGVQISRRLDIMARIGRQCEWWWPFENAVIASQRPVKVRWDGENRLHCENGPAIEYADGYAMYAWRGLRIPAEWITDGPPEAAEIMRLENTEQRRIACEMRGWHNILPALSNAKLIDRHPNPQVGELWEADLPDNGPERFLQVRCGTGRTFALPVGMQFKTAREANAATYGISPQILDNLQFRT